MPQPPRPPQKERFERLAWPCLPVLLRTARYLTRDSHRAEDLVQETMLKAYRAMESFADGTDIRAWLLTILRRTHLDNVRAEQRRGPAVSLEQAPPVEAEAEDDAGRHDQQWDNPGELMECFADQEVIDALKELPEDIRWTLLLVDVEQLDQAVAAQVLDVPVGTVKSRAHRGRKMLRDRLFDVARRHGWAGQGVRGGDVSAKESRHD
jgi:RNA polymerase sigma-70 factor, ECF subfamily